MTEELPDLPLLERNRRVAGFSVEEIINGIEINLKRGQISPNQVEWLIFLCRRLHGNLVSESHSDDIKQLKRQRPPAEQPPVNPFIPRQRGGH